MVVLLLKYIRCISLTIIKSATEFHNFSADLTIAPTVLEYSIPKHRNEMWSASNRRFIDATTIIQHHGFDVSAFR